MKEKEITKEEIEQEQRRRAVAKKIDENVREGTKVERARIITSSIGIGTSVASAVATSLAYNSEPELWKIVLAGASVGLAALNGYFLGDAISDYKDKKNYIETGGPGRI